MAGSGYLRQRRGELDHHPYFGERPSAYLTYSHIRLLADHRTGVAQVTARDVAKGTGMSVKVVRADLKWLCEADSITGRPAYLELIERGNQHRSGRYSVVKYPVTMDPGSVDSVGDKSNGDEGAVPPQGHSTSSALPPQGHSTRVVVPPQGHSTHRNVNNPNALTHPKKKEKKKKEKKNPSNNRSLGTKQALRAEGLAQPIGRILMDHKHTAPFGAEIAWAIHRHGRFTAFLRDFLATQIVPDFTKRRRKPNAQPSDFIRYARTRMSKLVEHEARSGKLHDGEVLLRPGTKRYTTFVDHHVTGPWRRIADAIKEPS